MGTGGVPIRPAYAKPHPSRPELVLLCDVSGSVAGFSHFTLQLVHSLREQFSRVRVFAFVDTTDEVTSFFETGSDLGSAMSRMVREAEIVTYDRYAEDREAIERACAETSVTELVDRDIAELSGGQRQRVWLAMALAQDTPVLLLDEPTTFLDPAHAIAMLELARGQARRGKAVVMVLHDLMLAGMYSDTLVVMKQGRILAEGAPSQALTPQVLEQAYGLRAEVWEDPAGGSPVIVPRGVVYSDWPS